MHFQKDITSEKQNSGGESIMSETIKEISLRSIDKMIYIIRGKQVMFDSDLAALYEVETKTLNRAVKRNLDRFPTDFMFQLTEDEFENLRCQNGTSRWGGRRYVPYVFTEQGVAMLSSVLRSERAVQVNIEIRRAFVRYRKKLVSWVPDIFNRTRSSQS